MTLLRDGAKELQLDPSYQKFLLQHPAEQIPKVLNKIGRYNAAFTFTLMTKYGNFSIVNWFRKIQKYTLYKIYVPSTGPRLLKYGSNLLSCLLLMSGAIIGFAIFHFLDATGKAPTGIKKFLS